MTQDNERDRLLISEQEQERPAPRHDDGEVDAQVRQFVIEAARLAADEHCEDVLAFDVRGVSQITDYLIIASGTSDVQMRAVGKHMEDLAKEHGLERFGSDRDDAVRWIVLDFVEVMVHLFEPATRAHYDLEMMWGDATRIPWRREERDKTTGF